MITSVFWTEIEGVENREVCMKMSTRRTFIRLARDVEIFSHELHESHRGTHVRDIERD